MIDKAWISRLLPECAAASPVLLESSSWTQIRALQDTGKDLVLLPVGATEQHGPHLPCSTDTMIALASCWGASACTGTMVLPPLNYTVSLGHTEKWPGTFSIFHETLIATVCEIGRWAAATGWRRLLVVNSHFGNDAPLRCAVDRLRFDLPGHLFVATRNTWSLTPDLAQAFSRDAADWHANEAETAILQYIAPDLVISSETADDRDRTAGCVFPHMVAHTSTNGVTGTPSTATPQLGAQLLRQICQALCRLIEGARSDEPPLAWYRQTTAFSH